MASEVGAAYGTESLTCGTGCYLQADRVRTKSEGHLISPGELSPLLGGVGDTTLQGGLPLFPEKRGSLRLHGLYQQCGFCGHLLSFGKLGTWKVPGRGRLCNQPPVNTLGTESPLGVPGRGHFTCCHNASPWDSACAV